ncbi:MAG: hypothetical protein ACFFE8_10570 [Candidatus Heimdallarchaeota archaeon]
MGDGSEWKRNRVPVIVFLICTILGSAIAFNESSGRVMVDPLQVYQVAHPLSVYQGEQFNLSVSITNTYVQDVLDVNMTAIIPSEFEFLYSTIPDLVPDDGSTDEDQILEYQFGTVPTQQYERFSMTLNVTSDRTATVAIAAVNVSYRLINGIQSFILAEPLVPIEILLKGKTGVTQEPTRLPLPSGTIAADPFFSVIGYLLPFLAFAISVYIMRRLLRKKTGSVV